MRNAYLLALLNVKNHRRTTLLFASMIAMLLVFYLCTYAVCNGFLVLETQFKTEDVELREISLFVSNEAEYDMAKLNRIRNLPHIVDASQYFNVDQSKPSKIRINDVEIECEKDLRGTNRSFSFAPHSKLLNLVGTDEGEGIIAGRGFLPTDKRTAIVDEMATYRLGFSNPEDAIGNKFTLVLSDMEIDSVEVVGVSSRKLGCYDTLTELDMKEPSVVDPLADPFYFSNDIIEEISKSSDVENIWYESFIVLVDNTDNVHEVCTNIHQLFGYETHSLIDSIAVKTENVNNVGIFLFIIEFIVAVIVCFGLASSIATRIDKRHTFNEMLLKIGYKKSDIVFSHVIENALVSLAATFVGFGCSFIGTMLYDLENLQAYSEISRKTKYVFLLDWKYGALVVTVVNLVIILFAYIITRLQLTKSFRRMNNEI